MRCNNIAYRPNFGAFVRKFTSPNENSQKLKGNNRNNYVFRDRAGMLFARIHGRDCVTLSIRVPNSVWSH